MSPARCSDGNNQDEPNATRRRGHEAGTMTSGDADLDSAVRGPPGWRGTSATGMSTGC
jgi:hypothetical protein